MSPGKNIIEIGKNTIRKEAASVAALEDLLDDQFEKAAELIFASKGRVVVSDKKSSQLSIPPGHRPFSCTPPTPSTATSG
jgi:hypothetical protein